MDKSLLLKRFAFGGLFAVLCWGLSACDLDCDDGYSDNSGVNLSNIEVTTVAGSGEIGDLDGTGLAVQFNNPDGVTVTNDGTAYITDLGNNEIKKITETGVTTTLAGSTTPGFVDGVGGAAQFNTPDGITHDSNGNIFVADAGNNAIRKITPDGTVTTIAGDGTVGDSDGSGAAAQFSFPTGITIDTSGNLYVSDQNNNEIRKITPDAVVTTIAGTGTAGFADGASNVAQFNTPHGIAIDASNNLYVTDMGNSRVRKITTDGQVLTIAGDGTAGDAVGPAAFSEINTPHGITVADSGDVYFADEKNNKIKVINTQGEVSTIAGSGSATFSDGAATDASFNAPRGFTITQSGDFLVCDYTNQRVRKIIVDENEVTNLAGSGAASDNSGADTVAAFNAPEGIAFSPSGDAFVADTGNNKIKKVSKTGVTENLAGSTIPGFVDGPSTVAKFDNPVSAVSDSDGNIYVADAGNNAIRKVTPEGVVTTVAGNGTAGNSDENGTSATFNNPKGLAIDASDNLYVADEGNNSVRKITPDGVVTKVAGTGVAGFADGTSDVAMFNAPKSVAVDDTGNIYVADTENDRVRMITPSGVVTTIAGNGSTAFADGPTATSSMNKPSGIVITETGKIYVADTGNNKIRMIDGEKVTTVAGTGEADDAVSSKAKKAKLNEPQGLALGLNKEILIADKDNNKIKKLDKRD